ncbi:MAG TPA: hypothetical protein VEJ63_16245 [Planctomycetota bacterium]|nr:hypothetical protein [Planctomycetota bacterium]
MGLKTSHNRILLVSVGLAIATLVSCWIVPYRMYQQGGYYAFAYVSDEMTYASRSQPLIAGTTAGNPVNGIGDASIISPFYLEDSIRVALNITGLNVITGFWLWRAAFPLMLLLAAFPFALACFRRSRLFIRPLALGFAAAVPALTYALYHLYGGAPPLHGWLERIPTNIEYPLSILVIAAFIHLIDTPSQKSGVLMAASSLILLYLRPYAAMPLVFTLAFGATALLLLRRVGWKDCVPGLAVLLLGAGPWIAINRWNGQSEQYREMMTRYFFSEEYRLHERWLFFAGLLAGYVLLAQFAPQRRRIFFYSAACGLAGLIFVPGASRLSSELLTDRFGCYYIPATLAAAAILVEHWISRGKGSTALKRATGVAWACCVLGFVAAAMIAIQNAQCDFLQWPNGPYALCLKERDYVRGYQWFETKTPPDALVLVDDGIDWSQAPADVEGLLRFSAALKLTSLDDLFQVVARRRRVHHIRLYGNVIATRDVQALAALHRGTFGRVMDPQVYSTALLYFRPQYVFWKKDSAPVGRGFGSALRRHARTVYEDDHCEIWELALPQPQ